MAFNLEWFRTLPSALWVSLNTSIRYGSLTIKRDSIDFEVIDFPPTILLGSQIRCNIGEWLGQATVTDVHDLVDVRSGHLGQTIAATRTSTVVPTAPSMTLSDVPSAVTDDYLLEDGSGTYLLEDDTWQAPGSFEMEGGSYGYRGLSVRTQINSSDGSTSTSGRLTCFQPGLWPGTQFHLISSNLGISQVYQVNQVTVSFLDAQMLESQFDVEFGLPGVAVDQTPWTLNRWRVLG